MRVHSDHLSPVSAPPTCLHAPAGWIAKLSAATGMDPIVPVDAPRPPAARDPQRSQRTTRRAYHPRLSRALRGGASTEAFGFVRVQRRARSEAQSRGRRRALKKLRKGLRRHLAGDDAKENGDPRYDAEDVDCLTAAEPRRASCGSSRPGLQRSNRNSTVESLKASITARASPALGCLQRVAREIYVPKRSAARRTAKTGTPRIGMSDADFLHGAITRGRGTVLRGALGREPS